MLISEHATALTAVCLADAAIALTGRMAIRTFRPFVRSQRTANDAGTLGPGCKRPRAFLSNLVEGSDDRVATRAYPHRALTPGDADFCTV